MFKFYLNGKYRFTDLVWDTANYSFCKSQSQKGFNCHWFGYHWDERSVLGHA